MRPEIQIEDDVLGMLRGHVPGAGLESAENGNSFVANWPAELKSEAFYGLVGEWVRIVEPHTEADPAALLVQFLVGFGSLIGRGPHYLAESDRHFTNLFAVIVGQTAKGRKGTSWGQVKETLRGVDEGWSAASVISGLSSGEGLIWTVRDEIKGLAKGKTEEHVIDPGVTDKRLLVVEGEFARVLQNTERHGNILSSVLRDSWDTGELSSITKNSPARATGAHISILGHITRDELRRLLTNTAAANGFANRFLWVCSRRSKCLPDGGAMDQVELSGIRRRLRDAAIYARTIERMERDSAARLIWHKVYPDLSEGKPGLFGAVTSRAEAQVLRLSCLYALLDRSSIVRAEHLMAGLAVWEYCEDSARFVFGGALGDPAADEIMRALGGHREGMTRTAIREHFGRNKSSGEIERALSTLLEYGRARMVVERADQGRPTERWHAISRTP